MCEVTRQSSGLADRVKVVLEAAVPAGWVRNDASLPGTPDFALWERKVVVFVNGCFLHQHGCRPWPLLRRNCSLWADKFRRTKAMDVALRYRYERRGWSCLTVWECRLKDPVFGEAKRLRTFLAKRKVAAWPDGRRWDGRRRRQWMETETGVFLRCSKCRGMKSESEFNRATDRTTGRRSACKPCLSPEAAARAARWKEGRRREKLLLAGRSTC